MGTGAKIAIGCGCLMVLGAAAVLGLVGAGAWWAKGKLEQASAGLDEMTAQAEQIEQYEKLANASAYTPPAAGVIPEDRLLTFLEARKRVYAVYERYASELGELQKKAESADDKLTLSELWSAGGALTRMAGEIRLAQVKALAAVGMSEREYRDIQLAVYKSAWAAAAETKTRRPPAEAVPASAPDEAGEVPNVPRANLELFRRHEAEIRKYAMHGLAFLGL
jgi:hypothetical protein